MRHYSLSLHPQGRSRGGSKEEAFVLVVGWRWVKTQIMVKPRGVWGKYSSCTPQTYCSVLQASAELADTITSDDFFWFFLFKFLFFTFYGLPKGFFIELGRNIVQISCCHSNQSDFCSVCRDYLKNYWLLRATASAKWILISNWLCCSWRPITAQLSFVMVLLNIEDCAVIGCYGK